MSGDYRTSSQILPNAAAASQDNAASPLSAEKKPSAIKVKIGLASAKQLDEANPLIAKVVQSKFSQAQESVENQLSQGASPDATLFLREQAQANAAAGSSGIVADVVDLSDDVAASESVPAGGAASAQKGAEQIAARIEKTFEGVAKQLSPKVSSSEAQAALALIHNSSPIQAHVDQANGHDAQAQANQGSQPQHHSPAAADAPAAQGGIQHTENAGVQAEDVSRTNLRSDAPEAQQAASPMAQGQSASREEQSSSSTNVITSNAKKLDIEKPDIEKFRFLKKIEKDGRIEFIETSHKEIDLANCIIYNEEANSLHAGSAELLKLFRENVPEGITLSKETKSYCYTNWEDCFRDFSTRYDQAVKEKAEETLRQQQSKEAGLSKDSKRVRTKDKDNRKEIVDSKTLLKELTRDTILNKTTNEQLKRYETTLKEKREKQRELEKEEEEVEEIRENLIRREEEHEEDEEVVLATDDASERANRKEDVEVILKQTIDAEEFSHKENEEEVRAVELRRRKKQN